MEGSPTLLSMERRGGQRRTLVVEGLLLSVLRTRLPSFSNSWGEYLSYSFSPGSVQKRMTQPILKKWKYFYELASINPHAVLTVEKPLRLFQKRTGRIILSLVSLGRSVGHRFHHIVPLLIYQLVCLFQLLIQR
ncbi:unnamed protein product [Timema podura]|uniref:Maturase K n=1 Tax=Timema podura TaxID=61482 RepID=A0ABN7NZB0_TIMPD|nr:unnamed protein product [Timema podura]